jgi:dTMP kinase
MASGKFIVFEGIEGSGKSTQAKLFYDELVKRGEKCILTAEPTTSLVGKMIRELLKSGNPVDMRTLQLLFIADRSEHIESLIKPKLEEGYTVISDRYAPSTIAYGTSFGKKAGLRLGYLTNIHKPFLAPDLLFFIDVPPERALERIQKRGGVKERFDELKSLQKLDENYDLLSRKYYPGTWKNIDGDRPVDFVTADLLKAWEDFSRSRR